MTVGRGVRLLEPSGFGSLLKRYRMAAGLTQEGLAELAGLSVRGISDLERGIAVRPQRETLAALTGALQLSSSDRGRLETAAGHRRTTVPGSLDVPGTARPVPPLVGRSPELSAIERHLAGDTSPVLVLAGEPGIGKSRLLQEGARLAAGRGYASLQGGGQRRSGQDPYAPMLDTLARSLAGLSVARLRLALAGCGWLARLLPELLEMASVPLPAGVLAPQQERRLVFAAVRRYLANLAGPAGILLVLDDLQWSGSDGLDLLASLVESGADHPIRVLCAYRDTEVGADHPLAALLTTLGERQLAEHIALAPLSTSEAMEVLDGLLSTGQAVDVRLRQRIVQRAGGVPFFLVSCALSIGFDAPGAAQSLPWNIAQSIRQRVAALPTEAREVLQAAAVMGRVFQRSTLLAVLGVSNDGVLAGLDAACRSRLLLRQGRATYRFAHDVVRESIEADLGEAQRVLLHRRVAEVLEELPEGERTTRAAELAWHFLEGDDRRRALLYTFAAGDEARGIFAYDEADRQYRAAAQLSREAHDAIREAEALEKLGTLYWALGRYDEALSQLEAAVELFERNSDLNSVGRVAGEIGWTHCHRGTGEEGIARLQALAARLENMGPSCALVDIYDSLVPLYWRRGYLDQGPAAAQRAADVANALGDKKAQVRGELNHGLVLWGRERLDDARQVLEAVIPRAEEINDTESLFRSLAWTANVYADMGQFERARSYLERAVKVTERAVSPSFHTSALDWLAELLFGLGNWRDAREYWERAIAVEPAIFSWAGGDAHLGLARLALAEGKRQEASAHLEDALPIFERTGWPAQDRRPRLQCVLAQKDLLEGQPMTAVARLEPDAMESRQSMRAGDCERQVLAEAVLELGDHVRAAELVEEGIHQTRASGHLPALTDWLRLRAAVLTCTGRGEEASGALEEGLTLARQMPHPYGAARILFEMGRLHATCGEWQLARERWREALTIFRQLGAQPYVERTERALDALAP